LIIKLIELLFLRFQLLKLKTLIVEKNLKFNLNQHNKTYRC